MFNNTNSITFASLLKSYIPSFSSNTRIKSSSVKEVTTPLFQALPPPPPANQHLIHQILPIVFLPLGIYLLVRKIARKCLLLLVESSIGKISEMVFPAPGKFQGAEKERWQRHKQRVFERPETGCNGLQVKSADGIKLDGAILWNNETIRDRYLLDPKTTLEGQKWIVCFNGNSMCYESYFDTADDFRAQTGYNILLFNYRGVIDSEGTSNEAYREEELILDGDAFIQFLLSRGVKSEDILVHGFSLGGGVGTQVGALHPKGAMCNYQSFSSIDGVVKDIVYRKLMQNRAKEDTWFANLLTRIIGTLAEGVLEEAGWRLNSADKWDQIEGYKWIVTADEDQLIKGPGRLYHSVKNRLEGYTKIDRDQPEAAEVRENNKKLKAQIKHVRSANTQHGGFLSAEAYQQHIAHMKAALGSEVSS